jgi:multiple sugar transport system substrate-binding protein
MRENHFRLFLLVCAAAAFLLTAAGAFAGGAKESTSGTAPSSTAVKQLSLWDFHGAAEGEFFKSLPDLYAQVNPNVKITVETVPWDDYLGTKLEAAFAAGAGPDLFFVSPGTIGKYINSGIAYPLNAFMTDTIVSDFSPSSIKGVSIGDKIYAIPFEIELVGLYYDADVLAAAGVQPPATWDDLKAAALKLKTDKRAGITIEVSKGAYQTYTWYPFLWQTGADVFTPDLKHSALDNPGVAKALQLWKDLIDSGAANLRPSRSTTDIGILGDGETAMQICGSWAIPTIENQYKDKNIKVVRLPIPEGGKPADVAGGWKFMVNAKGKYPEEAAKFAVWAFGTNIDLPLKWTTVVKFAYSPRKSVMAAGQSIFTKGLRAVFTKDIYGTEKPEIRMPAEASSILEDMIQNAMFNKDYDGAKAAMEANQRMEAFLKSYPGQI